MKNISSVCVLVILGLVVCVGVSACNRTDDTVQAARETPMPDSGTADSARGSARQNAGPLTQSDKDFLLWSEAFHIRQRNLARVAIQKSDDERVKEFAQSLSDEHSQALGKVVDVMSENGVAHPDDLIDAKKQALSRLDSLSGDALNQEFAKAVTNNNMEAIESFWAHGHAARHPDVRRYAGDVMPMILKHAEQARALKRTEIQSR